MHEQLGRIERDIGEIKTSLQEHMRRTAALESQVELIRNEITLYAAIRRVIAWLGGLVGAAAALVELWRWKR